MNFYTPRKNQGQIVTVSYAYSDAYAYRRTTDASDGSVAYDRGTIDWDVEPEGVDTERAPRVHSWIPCDPPQDD